MSLLNTNLIAILGAAFAAVLSVGSVTPAEAAPPDGMKWSDIAAPRIYRTQGQPARVGPAVQSPQFYSYAPVTMTPAAVAPVAPPATISIRGPDGIVRTYPVEGPVVQQGTPAFVSIRGADGVIRTYPVVGSTPVVGGTPAVPVVAPPCP